MVAVVLLATPWTLGVLAGALEPTVDAAHFQARLVDGLAGTVQRAGGAKALLACGDPYVGPFQVPVVAWQLRVHAARVQIEPRAPAVVFRARNATNARPGPSLAGVGGEAGVRTLAVGGGWRVVGRCR